jgi:hypothetical protein
LLEIVAVPPFFAVPVRRSENFCKRDRKNCEAYLPRAVAWQIIEIPHDLVERPRMRGRPRATDYQP